MAVVLRTKHLLRLLEGSVPGGYVSSLGIQPIYHSDQLLPFHQNDLQWFMVFHDCKAASLCTVEMNQTNVSGRQRASSASDEASWQHLVAPRQALHASLGATNGMAEQQ